MEQAYQNFNAGKYKEALNNLNSNPSNLESYEPNLAICEYMANRCQQSALNCLRKLNDLLTRKFKRDLPTHQPHTHNLIKLNIAVLMILQGRRDCALPILTDVFQHKDCFVESIQSRILLLLMELHLQAKNPLQALNLYRFYLLKPAEHRGHSHQWASLIIHEHGKTFAVAKEEYILMTRVYTNQAMMLLGAPCYYLSHQDQDDKLREQLLSRARRRKNNLNKYYETNVNLIGRFHEALRTLYNHNWQKCLSLMNFTTISEDLQGLPTTKIITNVISAFVNNNVAIVQYQLEKPAVASAYLAKAKTLLTKACTGVQDKDLHLFSLNYGGHLDSITHNQALTLLSIKPKESHTYFQSLRKSGQMSRSYKFWYRMAQSAIRYSEEPCLLKIHRVPLLNSALSSLNNALLCLDNHVIPTSQQLKNLTHFTDVQEEEIQGMIMKMNTQALLFRHSILTLICYVCLGLGLYRRVIRVGLGLLQQKKLDSKNRTNVLHYLFEAEAQLGKNTIFLRRYLQKLQQEVAQERGEVRVVYSKEENQEIEKTDYLTLFYHQLLRVNLWEKNVGQAANALMYIHQQNGGSQKQSMREAVKAVHLKYPLEKKFAMPYLKNP